MTIRASRRKSVRLVDRPGDRQGVARDAGGWLARLEQEVGAGTVGYVAIAAVLADGRMLVDPGARHFLMAAEAGLRERAERLPAILVCAVAIGALHHALTQRVMRGKIELRCHLGMTARAHPGSTAGVPKQDPLHPARVAHVPELAVVGVVAIAAENTRASVRRGRPAEQRLAANPVTSRAVFAARIANVGRPGGVGVSLCRAVAGFAICVRVAGDEVPFEGVVAIEAAKRANLRTRIAHGLGSMTTGLLRRRPLAHAREEPSEQQARSDANSQEAKTQSRLSLERADASVGAPAG